MNRLVDAAGIERNRVPLRRHHHTHRLIEDFHGFLGQSCTLPHREVHAALAGRHVSHRGHELKLPAVLTVLLMPRQIDARFGRIDGDEREVHAHALPLFGEREREVAIATEVIRVATQDDAALLTRELRLALLLLDLNEDLMEILLGWEAGFAEPLDVVTIQFAQPRLGHGVSIPENSARCLTAFYVP